MEEKPTKPRRWFQFSVRALFILTTACAVGFAGHAWWSHKAYQQRIAVAKLKEAGCLVIYDYRVRNLNEPPYYPAWLVDTLGVDYFANVQAVWFRNRQVSDDDLAYLTCLTSLQRLLLKNTSVTDAGLKHLKGLTTLHWLYLNDTRITDAGLETLNFPALQTLDLSNTHVTDAGLVYMCRLTALEELNLRGTQVTDAGLEYLKGLTPLRILDLDDTKVSVDGVARLQQALPNCGIRHSRPL